MIRPLIAALFISQAVHGEVVPEPQRGMESRHQKKVEAVKAERFDLLMIGDSITQNFEKPAYQDVWNRFFGSRNAINLGYSGGRTENTLWNLQNGELEGQSPKAVVLLIGTNDTDDANYQVVHTPEEVFEGTAAIVKLLRERCPSTKILLLRVFPRANVYKKPDGSERGSAAKRSAANLKAGELVAKLADGRNVFYQDVNHVFYRPDGTLDPRLVPDLLHPGPEGSLAWASAIEPTLAKLMGDEAKVPTPANHAIVPVSKLENDSYDWFKRHEKILEIKDSLNPEIVLIGDSITHFWGGDFPPPDVPARGPKSWNDTFGGKRVLNLGFGWDRTQNVLWRLDHGEFDGLRPHQVVILIGTNNLSGTKNARTSTPQEIADGIREIILRVRSKSPGSHIVLMGILPRSAAYTARITATNEILRKDWSNVPGLSFVDITQGLSEGGKLKAGLFSDGTHPTERGYAVWGSALKAVLDRDP